MNWTTTAKRRVKKRKDFSYGMGQLNTSTHTGTGPLDADRKLQRTQHLSAIHAPKESSHSRNQSNQLSADVLYLGKRKSTQLVSSSVITNTQQFDPWKELELTPPDQQREPIPRTKHRTPFCSPESVLSEQHPLFFNDGVQCADNTQQGRTSASTNQQETQTILAAATINANVNATVAHLTRPDTPTYSPALQFKQRAEEQKRKASVHAAMREISELLPNEHPTLQTHNFTHADMSRHANEPNDGIGDDDEDVVDCEGGWNHHANPHKRPYSNDVSDGDPLSMLYENVSERTIHINDHDSNDWRHLPHATSAHSNEDWVLFGGDISLTVPVQDNYRSSAVSPHDDFAMSYERATESPMVLFSEIPDNSRYRVSPEQFAMPMHSEDDYEYHDRLGQKFPGLLRRPPVQVPYNLSADDSRLHLDNNNAQEGFEPFLNDKYY